MSAGEDLREKQRAQWRAAAAGWDKWHEWNEKNTRPILEWFAGVTSLQPGQRLLDIGCGSGLPVLRLAARVGPGGVVVATDASPEMLAVARRRAAAAGLDHIEFQGMDAQELDFPDHSFDAVTFGFGLMFCPDPGRAAREIRRVLKPGGRFALSAWDDRTRNPFFTLLGMELQKVAPMPPPPPEAPGMFRFGQPGALEALLRESGMSGVKVEEIPLSFALDSPAQYWEVLGDCAAPLKAILDTLSEAQRAQVKQDVIRSVETHVQGGPTRLSAVALGASGTAGA